ncbi:hypothetical protein SNE25_08610 [Mucilaginibacter sabulilitoris]|uniref:Uncharacterized protein n=1 Tax=Mucilaginibacter sabulilitoris TaxID=1173583 RepID=A0ABZ0TU31_9SPHI|nr:hypothetical protein [Mucilaginibacter sabulilitoris]WPU95583.1 hypothetical protein SNE25_08610 [Mucilaginibacter sabulilitoris]
MKIEDAITRKAKLPFAISFKGRKMRIYLVPQLPLDLEKFIEHLKGHRVTDKTALLFSSDKQFTVKAIAIDNGCTTILNYQELGDILIS